MSMLLILPLFTSATDSYPAGQDFGAAPVVPRNHWRASKRTLRLTHRSSHHTCHALPYCCSRAAPFFHAQWLTQSRHPGDVKASAVAAFPHRQLPSAACAESVAFLCEACALFVARDVLSTLLSPETAACRHATLVSQPRRAPLLTPAAAVHCHAAPASDHAAAATAAACCCQGLPRRPPSQASALQLLPESSSSAAEPCRPSHAQLATWGDPRRPRGF